MNSRICICSINYMAFSGCCMGSSPNRAFKVMRSSEYLSSGLNRAASNVSTWVRVVRVLAVIQLHLQCVYSLAFCVQIISQVHSTFLLYSEGCLIK